MSEHEHGHKEIRLAVAAVIVAAICVAFAPLFAKMAVNNDVLYGNKGISPTAVGFWRMFISVPVVFAFWFFSKERTQFSGAYDSLKRSVKYPLIILLLPAFFFTLDLGVWHSAFEYTTIANATLEANLSAILVPLFSYFIWRQRFNMYFVIGSLISFVSLIGLIGVKFTGDSMQWFGDLLGIMAAFCYGSYQLSSKVLTRHFSTLTIMLLCVGGVSVFFFIYHSVLGENVFPQNISTFNYLIALALVSQVLGQGLVIYSLNRLKAATVAVTLLLQPVATSFLGCFFLEQVLTYREVLFSMGVLLGIAVTILLGRVRAS